ncbi:monocarboxylate transporter 10-like [Gigantopelta aegis]|uniref:monocarboxylate transporter 10-like n=1 Tax=Gigantopelta aegis TaxID=1735272 RepID=UPI001B88E0F1|nr:monocarboxylate transporter 10-like [Gigantopelta aegis]
MPTDQLQPTRPHVLKCGCFTTLCCRSEHAWVGSVCTGITFLMCMVSSIVSDRLGIRKTALFGGLLCIIGLVSSAFVEELQLLYLTYGILLGLGMAFTYSPSLVILGHYFKRHMGLVNGIVTFGSAVFTIVLSLVLPRLLASVGLRYTLIMLGALNSLLVVCALTWKPLLRRQSSLARLALSTESIAEHCTDCCTWTRKFLNVNIWRNRGYVVWAVSSGLSLFGYFVPFVHLIKHTNDIFPDSDGSLLIMCMSITSGIGRIVFGKVADFAWVSRIRMQQIALAVLGITTMCIPFSASFGGLIAITLVMGICDGVFVCLIGPIAFDIVGPVGASQAIGFILGIFSVPMMIGPPVAGFLYDHLGSYKIAFHAAGAPPILGAAIMFFIPAIKQNYPAVTEIEEFAAVSLHNILEGTSASHTTEGNYSSPAESELLVIKDTSMLKDFQETVGELPKDPETNAPETEMTVNKKTNSIKDMDNS